MQVQDWEVENRYHDVKRDKSESLDLRGEYISVALAWLPTDVIGILPCMKPGLSSPFLSSETARPKL